MVDLCSPIGIPGALAGWFIVDFSIVNMLVFQPDIWPAIVILMAAYVRCGLPLRLNLSASWRFPRHLLAFSTCSGIGQSSLNLKPATVSLSVFAALCHWFSICSAVHARDDAANDAVGSRRLVPAALVRAGELRGNLPGDQGAAAVRAAARRELVLRADEQLLRRHGARSRLVSVC